MIGRKLPVRFRVEHAEKRPLMDEPSLAAPEPSTTLSIIEMSGLKAAPR
jgi:hypothetical protein